MKSINGASPGLYKCFIHVLLQRLSFVGIKETSVRGSNRKQITSTGARDSARRVGTRGGGSALAGVILDLAQGLLSHAAHVV